MAEAIELLAAQGPRGPFGSNPQLDLCLVVAGILALLGAAWWMYRNDEGDWND